MTQNNSENPADTVPNTRRRIIITVTACAVVLGGVFGGKALIRQQMNAYFDSAPMPQQTISSALASRMRWPNEIASVGTVTPAQGTDVTTEAGGIVAAIHFESGKRVEAGDPLISLKADTESAELARLEAQAELADNDRRRARELLARKALSQADYDLRVSQAHAARAAVKAQAAKLAQKSIDAPFSGVLGIRRVNVGQYLAPGTAIVTLQSLDPIDVEFALPEHQASKLARGLPVEITVQAWPAQQFNGQIIAVEPRVATATRTISSQARLANPDERLRAGMFARVNIDLPGDFEVLAIPRTAVKYDAYGTQVFVIGPEEDGQRIARSRFVLTGTARGDYVQVLQGLEEGDEVVIAGLLKLRNGTPVSIDNEVLPDLQLEPRLGNS